MVTTTLPGGYGPGPGTTEVRTVSDTGGAKGVKLARFDMIPADSLWELAEHFGKGAEKYETGEDGLDNWRHGYEWAKSFGAMFRHATQALGGEDIDPETGSKHLIAVAWHALVLAHWMNDESKARFDNRQAVLERKANPDRQLTPSEIHAEFLKGLGFEVREQPYFWLAGDPKTPAPAGDD